MANNGKSEFETSYAPGAGASYSLTSSTDRVKQSFTPKIVPTLDAQMDNTSFDNTRNVYRNSDMVYSKSEDNGPSASNLVQEPLDSQQQQQSNQIQLIGVTPSPLVNLRSPQPSNAGGFEVINRTVVPPPRRDNGGVRSSASTTSSARTSSSRPGPGRHSSFNNSSTVTSSMPEPSFGGSDSAALQQLLTLARIYNTSFSQLEAAKKNYVYLKERIDAVKAESNTLHEKLKSAHYRLNVEEVLAAMLQHNVKIKDGTTEITREEIEAMRAGRVSIKIVDLYAKTRGSLHHVVTTFEFSSRLLGQQSMDLDEFVKGVTLKEVKKVIVPYMSKPLVAALYVFDNVKRAGCIYTNAIEDKLGETIHKKISAVFRVSARLNMQQIAASDEDVNLYICQALKENSKTKVEATGPQPRELCNRVAGSIFLHFGQA